MKLSLDETYWFALKAGRRDNAAAQLFDSMGSTVFVARTPTTVVRHGKKVVEEKNLIPNVIFVRDTFRKVNAVRALNPFVTYTYHLEDSAYRITTVPEKDMQRFRHYVESMRDDLRYFRPEEVELQKGDKVRIIGGPLDGYEGTLLRAKGRQKRMFVVDFDLLGALGTHVEPEYIQIL